MLKNRFDIAATLTTGASSVSGFTNIGLMLRVHFPIPNTKFSPNLGLQLSYNIFGLAQTTNVNFVIGASWFIGFGSLDFAFKLGDQTGALGGYTMSPQPDAKK